MDEKGEDYIILIGSECLIITTRMVEKGEDYITIILIGAPAKLCGAGGMLWWVSNHSLDVGVV